MNGFDACSAKLLFEPQVKIRRVDADEYIRWMRNPIPDELLTYVDQLEQATEHFNQAHHRETFHRHKADHAFALHHRTTNALKRRFWILFLQRADKTGTQHISGSFSGHQRDSHISG